MLLARRSSSTLKDSAKFNLGPKISLITRIQTKRVVHLLTNYIVGPVWQREILLDLEPTTQKFTPIRRKHLSKDISRNPKRIKTIKTTERVRNKLTGTRTSAHPANQEVNLGIPSNHIMGSTGITTSPWKLSPTSQATLASQDNLPWLPQDNWPWLPQGKMLPRCSHTTR